MSDATNERPTPPVDAEPVAWDNATLDAVGAKLRKWAGMIGEYYEIPESVRARYREDACDLLSVIPHPPRVRAVEAVQQAVAKYDRTRSAFHEGWNCGDWRDGQDNDANRDYDWTHSAAFRSLSATTPTPEDA